MCSSVLLISLAIFGGLPVKSEPNEDNRRSIISGYDASNWSFFVKLVMRLRDTTDGVLGRAMCGGTIIRSDVVLTAAHCLVSGYPYETFRVRVQYGDFTRKDVIKWDADNWMPHPQYNEAEKIHDIGLVFMGSRFPNKFERIPLCDSSYFGHPITAIGIGRTQANPPLYPDFLQEVQLQETGYNSCGFDINYQLQICLHGRDGIQNVCQGDSGGPVFPVNQYGNAVCLYGITSYVHGGKRLCREDSVHTRVSGYLDWINTSINNEA